MTEAIAYEEEKPRRFGFIDVVKGVALVAMVIYHIGFDLSAQRLIAFNVIEDPAWTAFARLIASTFVGMAGFNLVLATRGGLRPERFFRRLAILVAAAALVSAGTWWFDRDTFVFFGILHVIAASSVLGLAFVRLSVVVTGAAAAFFLVLPAVFSHPLFDVPALWWVGLSATVPVSIDYTPVFPWFGVALIGIAAGNLFAAHGTESALASWTPRDRAAGALAFIGRWTLPIYLIHQPIIVGLIFLASPFVPPDIGYERERFTLECVPACESRRREDVSCIAFCVCMFEGLWDTDLYTVSSLDAMTDDQSTRWNELLNQCVAEQPLLPLD